MKSQKFVKKCHKNGQTTVNKLVKKSYKPVEKVTKSDKLVNKNHKKG